MNNLKKAAAGLICAVLSASAVASVSANEWIFSGYSTDSQNIQTGVYNKIWYEVDEHGIPTGNEKLEGVAENVEWRYDFYEALYPHNMIERLYLHAIKTSVRRDSRGLPDLETKFIPDMWEVQYPYRIYERLNTYRPDEFGTWDWLPNKLARDPADGPIEHRGLYDTDQLKYLGKNEPVTQTYEYFGFGPYRIIDKETIESGEYRPGSSQALYNDYYKYAGAKTLNGDYIVDASKLLEDLGIDYTGQNTNSDWYKWDSWLADTGKLCQELSKKDSNGQYIISNEEIAAHIPIFKSEYLRGSDYGNGGMQKIDTATYYTKTKDESMFNPHFIMDCSNDYPAQISWTEEYYQKDFPYKQYQYLIIDGVVCDGSWVGFDIYGYDVWLPYIYRYTGGNESPDVQWVYAFIEEAYPHEVYFEKILDGVPTGVYKSFEQRGGRYGTVIYADTIGELDYKLKSEFGIAEYNSDDIFYDGYVYSINIDVQDQITNAANAAMQ